MTAPTQEEMVEVLYKNLQTVYTNLVNNWKEMKREESADALWVIRMLVKDMLDHLNPEKGLGPETTIKDLVYTFNRIDQVLPNQTRRIFRGYQEAPKVGFDKNRTYTYHHEVMEFCRKVEPKILAATK